MRNPPRFDHAEAERLYRSGLSSTQVGKIVGAASNNVTAALRRRGCPIRSISVAKVIRHAGAKSKQTRGYVFVRIGKGQRVLEHRLVAERALGRPLKTHEHVHHINCDTADNRPENLLICTRAYHTWLHKAMQRHPYWSTLENTHVR